MSGAVLPRLRNVGVVALVVLLLLGAALLVARLLRDDGVPQRHAITTVMKVVLPPPPPPPPKPPQEPPPQPQKMLEQPKVTTSEPPKPSQAKAAPTKAAPSSVPKPPGNPLTAEAGPGANPYGLAVGNGSGDVVGGGGGGGGSQFGYYAGLIQSQVQAALQHDEKARAGRFKLMVRIWLGPGGRVTRAQLGGSTGNAALDAAIERVLAGVTIGESPPADMPQPINVRITAQG
jgi:periplasmic protein TonB